MQEVYPGSQQSSTNQAQSFRMKTGIPGFDEITGGGLIPNRTYLLTGPAGVGKTIFSAQFLHAGASLFGEPGIYITFEEEPNQLRQDLISVGINLAKLEAEKLLIVLDACASRLGLGSGEQFTVRRPYSLEYLLYVIGQCVRELRARRIVLDCLDAMELDGSHSEEYRKSLGKLGLLLKAFGCTTIVVSESNSSEQLTRIGVSEFTFDGIIRLSNNLEHLSLLDGSKVLGVRTRRLEIVKLRGAKHSPYIHVFYITKNGIVVAPRDKLVDSQHLTAAEE